MNEPLSDYRYCKDKNGIPYLNWIVKFKHENINNNSYNILKTLFENTENARNLNVNFKDNQTNESCIFTLIKQSQNCNGKLSYFLKKCKEHHLCLNLNIKNKTDYMSPFGYALINFNKEYQMLLKQFNFIKNNNDKNNNDNNQNNLQQYINNHKFMFEILLEESDDINPNLSIGKPEFTPIVYVLCVLKNLKVTYFFFIFYFLFFAFFWKFRTEYVLCLFIFFFF